MYNIELTRDEIIMIGRLFGNHLFNDTNKIDSIYQKLIMAFDPSYINDGNPTEFMCPFAEYKSEYYGNRPIIDVSKNGN